METKGVLSTMASYCWCDKASVSCHCNEAHCNEAHCNEAHCNEAHCNEAHCNEAHCNEAHCNEAHCNEAHCNEAHCNEANCVPLRCPCEGKAFRHVTWRRGLLLTVKLFMYRISQIIVPINFNQIYFTNQLKLR